MATAWKLSNETNWQERFDITLYQTGWRLGGKCASGRGPNDRIEEHGIHVLMGFYDTVFGILHSCYGEINRPAGSPLATWREAVAPQDKVVLTENINGNWLQWEFKYPFNSKTPGENPARRHPHAVLRAIIRQTLATTLSSPLGHSPQLPCHGALYGATDHHDELKNALHSLRHSDEDPQITDEEKQRLLEHLDAYMNHVLAMPLAQYALHGGEGAPVIERDRPVHRGFLSLVEDACREVEGFVARVGDEIVDAILRDLRRALIQLKIACAMVRGILLDGVLTPHGWDFAAINHLDLSEWIGLNLQGWPGTHEETTHSAPIRGIYDLVFGYADGVPGQFALEAGTSLDFMIRIVHEFKGAIYWKMLAGMGDAVLAPMYLALKKRGVRFEFFHAVRALHLDEASTRVQAVEINRQVEVKGGEYDPLFDVKGLPCFPDQPLYERLEINSDEAATLRELQREFNGLESPWTTWRARDTLRLEAGRDFDKIVLGISVAALSHLCPELRNLPRWAAMLDAVKTTATQSGQLWLKPTLEGSGWTRGACIMDAYAQPFNSWTDMTDLIERESWPATDTPGSIAYFTGPLPNQSTPPPFDQHSYAAEQCDAARHNFRDWLGKNTGDLLPRAVVPGTPALDFELLIAPGAKSNDERFDAQYWRANVNPSDHYVLSVPGSSAHRLAPGDSGLSNLVLAGDWTLCGLNAGCVEAAATSGVLAAQALMGEVDARGNS